VQVEVDPLKFATDRWTSHCTYHLAGGSSSLVDTSPAALSAVVLHKPKQPIATSALFFARLLRVVLFACSS
jgi:hypothetical protein